MKRCNVCWVASLGGFAIAIFGFAVVMHGWPWPSGSSTETSHVVAWITAVGTVGAALATTAASVIALKFGLSEERRSASRRAGTTTFCREASRKELRDTQIQLLMALYELRSVLSFLRRGNFTKLLSSVYRSKVLHHVGQFRFDTYGSLSRWMPEIEELLALAFVRISATASTLPREAEGVLRPFNAEVVPPSVAADACISLLNRMRPFEEDLRSVIGNETGEDIEALLDSLLLGFGAISAQWHPDDDDPDSFGNPLQKWDD